MDDDEPPEDPDEDQGLPPEPPVEVYERPDGLVEMLVRLANSARVEIPVTLVVRGCVVTGMLVSGADFFADFGERFASNFEGSASAEIRRRFDTEAIRYNLPTGPGAPVQMIHVKDAWVDGSAIGSGWWRGHISRVDGWSFGYRRAE